jgi:hypothetical protein
MRPQPDSRDILPLANADQEGAPIGALPRVTVQANHRQVTITVEFTPAEPRDGGGDAPAVNHRFLTDWQQAS